MPKIEDHLAKIQAQMARNEREEPRRALEELIVQMSLQMLDEWDSDIMKLVNQFHHKKRRDLLRVVDRKRQGATQLPPVPHGDSAATSPPPLQPVEEKSNLSIAFDMALDDLAERHIFQWSTFYRECLDVHLSQFLAEVPNMPSAHQYSTLSDPLSRHSQNIFARGYTYARSNGHSHDDAIQKSIGGLSRFLRLPLDYYSARWSSASDYESSHALRLLASGTLSGIVGGYCDASFGTTKGGAVLAQVPHRWMHCLAFLTPTHAESVVARIASGPLNKGVMTSVIPLLDALKVFFDRRHDDYFPIPVVGQYMGSQRRLDISIRPPRYAGSQRLVEVRAFLDRALVSTESLSDAARRQVAVVLAPLRPDLQKFVKEHVELETIVVPATTTRAAVADRAAKALDQSLFALRGRPSKVSRITYNFAREFPLHNPGRAKFFHVDRTSVRDLLRTFERRNGVRLWCSVRRSGKTTACFDLESTTDDSVIVGQTCGATQSEGSTRFYDRVAEALDSGRMLQKTFLSDVIAECAPVDLQDRRLVLVIDEYETLFGLLQTAVEDAQKLRYTVVQPILNQLRSFADENLLVFLGQQPNAHFILMDQNQLAPYVEQDAFPLFEHVVGTTKGEFADLVHRILGGHIDCGSGFMDVLFQETSGHPYLTATVLIEFVEWLIEERRSQKRKIVERDFVEFLRERLCVERIQLSPEYDFFRKAAADAMSQRGYETNRWLFTAYWALRTLATGEQTAFQVERAAFGTVMRRIPVPVGEAEPDAADVLRSASLANFLAYDERWVSVKVRTLGRIAAAVQPSVV